MIAWLLIGIVAVMILACAWFGLAIIAGFARGCWDMVLWFSRRRRGLEPGVPPWDRPMLPAANAAPIPFEVRAAVWARDGGQCVYCGATEDLTIDHVVPRAHGGSSDPANLVTACRKCNASKGTGDAPGHASAHVQMLLADSFQAAHRATNGHR